MPKVQTTQSLPTPYKLALNRAGIWELRWSERSDRRWLVRTWSTGSRERAEADLKAAEFWDARQVISTHIGATRVRECVDGYLRAAEKGKGVGPTQRWSLTPVSALLGYKSVVSLGSEDIEDYREQRRRRGIKSGTIRRELGALVAALNWAVKQKSLGLTKHDLPDVELGTPSPARNVYLHKPQEQDFWNLALADTTSAGELSRVARYVCLALGAAQRSQANLELTWDRVDFTRGLINFNPPGRVTTSKRRSVVPIADRLRPVLERAWRESQARGEAPDALVCGQGSIRKAWSTWLSRTPYPHIHPHDLRRTWASLAVQAGRPVYEVAKVLGDTVEMVENVYGVLAPEHLKNTMNAA
jgi:integrase